METAPAARGANSLEAFWMGFTSNRAFKQHPRLLATARDMHYFTPDGRAILDGTAGLWCVNAGHGRRKIIEAITRQAA
ncbi:MAG: aspartate aminotransferase family protein, partial [Caulobacteraceae bacterium]|nr:aspartate aminotransferase family protein [Caulobacteraceae bacterium]